MMINNIIIDYLIPKLSLYKNNGRISLNFPKSISPKVNVTVRLELELASNAVTV